MPLTELWWLQQTNADVPAENRWLSLWEADRAATLLISKRRNDWRLGRWTAKRAVAVVLGMPQDVISLSKIEVKPTASGAPEVFVSNAAPELTISLSHREGVAICAVAAGGVQLGCDLELIEAHSEAFIRDYFTMDEQAIIAASHKGERQALVALIWSTKESALKALTTGLREDTRSVSVYSPHHSVGSRCWTELDVRLSGGRQLSGWWQTSDRLLRTIIAEPKARSPLNLAPSCDAMSPVNLLG